MTLRLRSVSVLSKAEGLGSVFWFCPLYSGGLLTMSRKMGKTGHEEKKKPKLSKKEKRTKKHLKEKGA